MQNVNFNVEVLTERKGPASTTVNWRARKRSLNESSGDRLAGPNMDPSFFIAPNLNSDKFANQLNSSLLGEYRPNTSQTDLVKDRWIRSPSGKWMKATFDQNKAIRTTFLNERMNTVVSPIKKSKDYLGNEILGASASINSRVMIHNSSSCADPNFEAQ